MSTLKCISSRPSKDFPPCTPQTAVAKSPPQPIVLSFGNGDDDRWPHPETDEIPEQPPTAAYLQKPLSCSADTGSEESAALFESLSCPWYEKPLSRQLAFDSEELAETICEEKSLQHPQVVSYCLGVTSLGHNLTSVSNEEPQALVEASTPPYGSSEESTAAASPRSSDMPSAVLSPCPEDEDEEEPRCADDQPHPELATDDVVDEQHCAERVVANVSDLRSTMFGLLAVAEDAELPDVPNPFAPSKSDSSILHGSVAFDNDIRTWLHENEIPEEATILDRESATLGKFRIDAGMALSIVEHVKSLQAVVDEDESRDPRGQGMNMLVRSHHVGSNLSAITSM
jgi:hypothetical protein